MNKFNKLKQKHQLMIKFKKKPWMDLVHFHLVILIKIFHLINKLQDKLILNKMVKQQVNYQKKKKILMQMQMMMINKIKKKVKQKKKMIILKKQIQKKDKDKKEKVNLKRKKKKTPLKKKLKNYQNLKFHNIYVNLKLI